MNLTQGEKISLADAKKLLIKTCSSSARCLADIHVLERAMEEDAMGSAEAAADRELSSTARSFRRFAPVDAWMRGFDECAMRYSFLVLDGPSKMGKSQFAKSLARPCSKCLEINCASGAEPDLRAYSRLQHSCILFDEVMPATVLAQRKLFQACHSRVQLGCSSTNCHCYTVYLHRVPLILAANNWHCLLSAQPSAEADWIRANQVYMYVDAPMWEQD